MGLGDGRIVAESPRPAATAPSYAARRDREVLGPVGDATLRRRARPIRTTGSRPAERVVQQLLSPTRHPRRVAIESCQYRQIAPRIRRPTSGSSAVSDQRIAARRLSRSCQSRSSQAGESGPIRYGPATSARSRKACAWRRSQSGRSPDRSSRSPANSCSRVCRSKRGSPCSVGWIFDEALVRQGLEPVDDQQVQAAVRVDDVLGALDIPAAAEDRTPSEDRLLVRRQEVVAPGDRATQRPLALGQVARAAGEEVEARRQPLEDRPPARTSGSAPRRARWRAGGPRDGRRWPGPPPGRRRRARRRAGRGGRGRGRAGRRRRVERRDPVLVLTGDPQALATGDHDPQTRRRAQELGDVGRGVRQQLLEVVEDEQRDERLEVRPERLRDRDARFLADAERGGDRARDEARVADRGEIDEPRPAREPIGDRRGQAQREARLARAARSGQGQQPRLGEGRRRASRGRPRGRRSSSAGSAGSSARRWSGADDRRRPIPGTTSRWSGLGSSKSLSRRGPTDDERACRRGRVPSRADAGRVGQGDLAAVRGRRDARRVVDVDADVVRPVSVRRPSPVWRPIRTRARGRSSSSRIGGQGPAEARPPPRPRRRRPRRPRRRRHPRA